MARTLPTLKYGLGIAGALAALASLAEKPNAIRQRDSADLQLPSTKEEAVPSCDSSARPIRGTEPAL